MRLLLSIHLVSSLIIPGHLRNRSKRQISIRCELNNEFDSKVDTNSPRLYVSNGILSKGQIIDLSSDQSHYLSKVLRFFSGRSKYVRLFDGLSGEWVAQILEPDLYAGKRKRNDTTLRAKCLFQSRPMPSESKLDHTWLFFAPLKIQRTKLLIEKCTEIGCSLFIPINTDHTESSTADSFNDRADDRLKTSLYINSSSSSVIQKLSIIAMEASEQSERLSAPKFFVNLHQALTSHQKDSTYNAPLQTWTASQLLEFWTENISDRLLLICRERSTTVLPLLTALNRMKEVEITKAAFLIGPEGGWSSSEEDLFDRWSSEFPQTVMCVSLGSSILRAETAAMVATGSFSLWLDSVSTQDEPN